MDRAVIDLAARLGEPDGPLAIWRIAADDEAPDQGSSRQASPAARRRDRMLGEVEQRLATAPLFGGGTLVVVRQPDSVIREGASRLRLLALIETVPEGNGLCFTELVAAGAKAPPGGGAVARAVQAAGGLVRAFPALTRMQMEAWITSRAGELGVTIAPGVARLLAERIGAYVRESDVDRRRQAEVADQELQKLALFRPGGTITRDDVIALVTEAIPGSVWAFLDAVGQRRARDATILAERLLEGAIPPPVLISQLHRRLRELVLVREHIDTGSSGPALMRAMKLQPYRAQKLEEQARRWKADELVEALEGLLELDLASKGIALDGSARQSSDGRTALGFQQWLAEAVISSR